MLKIFWHLLNLLILIVDLLGIATNEFFLDYSWHKQTYLLKWSDQWKLFVGIVLINSHRNEDPQTIRHRDYASSRAVFHFWHICYPTNRRSSAGITIIARCLRFNLRSETMQLMNCESCCWFSIPILVHLLYHAAMWTGWISWSVKICLIRLDMSWPTLNEILISGDQSESFTRV